MKKVKIVVGRFNPPHIGHLSLFRAAVVDCDKLIIVLGSADHPNDTKNPFSDHDRTAMISAMLTSDPEIKNLVTSSHGTPRCATYYVGVRDHFYGDRDVRWCTEVRDKVNQLLTDEECEITLVGHHRDDTSYYLDMFPEWKYQEVDEGEDGLNSTLIRKSVFTHGKVPTNSVVPSVETFINHWVTTKAYENLRGDWLMDAKVLKQASGLAHAQTFVTADATVFHKGRVLMIIRGRHPGKGLLALPGGYLDIKKDRGAIDNAIRELKEETGLILTETTCKTHPNFPGTFDNPNRSTRGSITTHVYKWVLDADKDFPVIGSDDAVHALWVPLSDIQRKYYMIFEDHAEIIEIMANT